MWKDSIVDEVRTTRERLAKKEGYNLHKIILSARRRQNKMQILNKKLHRSHSFLP
jgi:hypothetical protein